ncbi:ATP-binding protein [Streptomyces sp. NBC_00820]|uniref:ATP-binding protein n=1 Tax=Streptomyces sp. NBC_00820 TaxID=2975842 RepID=UPI002ED69750|nr:ATP-binding protein [Streptomyces sp. NBC_00820]
MTSETIPPSDTTQLTSPVSTFSMLFSSTPRGARLARRLAGHRLDTWGIPYDSDPHDALTLIVAELCANAVRHGHVPGRDFRLQLTCETKAVRVEVTDTRTERLPATHTTADPVSERGRGLLLVTCLATRWDWHQRPDGPGKTVWAEYELPSEGCTAHA